MPSGKPILGCLRRALVPFGPCCWNWNIDGTWALGQPLDADRGGRLGRVRICNPPGITRSYERRSRFQPGEQGVACDRAARWRTVIRVDNETRKTLL